MNELLLENVDKVKTRNLIGKYIIYYKEVVIGGLRDNRLLGGVQWLLTSFILIKEQVYVLNVTPQTCSFSFL